MTHIWNLPRSGCFVPYIELRDTVHVPVSHVNQTGPVPTNENTAAPACCVLIGREPAGYHPEDQS